MAGVSETVLRTIANALLVLIVAGLLITVIFVQQSELLLKGSVKEQINLQSKELDRQCQPIVGVCTPDQLYNAGLKVLPEIFTEFKNDVMSRVSGCGDVSCVVKAVNDLRTLLGDPTELSGAMYMFDQLEKWRPRVVEETGLSDQCADLLIAFALDKEQSVLGSINLKLTGVIDVDEAKAIVENELNNFVNNVPELAESLKKSDVIVNECSFAKKIRISFQAYDNVGLTKPFIERVFIYFSKAVTLQFQDLRTKPGVTYVGAEAPNALAVIKAALPASVMLFTTATIINIILGIFLGLQAAKRAGGLLDRTLSTGAMISASLPMWWVGMLMLYIFAYKIPIFPMVAKDVYSELGVLAQHVSGPMFYIQSIPIWLKYMTLPLITVVMVSFGAWAYIIRNVVFTTMSEDFVWVARAKGVPERRVLYKHVLRAASPPIVTMSALSLVGSMGGAIITETVFQWPGMGFAYWTAINNGDSGVLIALTYMFVFLFVAVIVLLDFIYALLDPRVRVGGAPR